MKIKRMFIVSAISAGVSLAGMTSAFGDTSATCADKTHSFLCCLTGSSEPTWISEWDRGPDACEAIDPNAHESMKCHTNDIVYGSINDTVSDQCTKFKYGTPVTYIQ